MHARVKLTQCQRLPLPLECVVTHHDGLALVLDDVT
jgi:hypothetical protein